MADRGFDIGDSAVLFGATVEIPAFMKGKKQLSSFDVEMSRMLASVRVHAERVVGWHTVLGLPYEKGWYEHDHN